MPPLVFAALLTGAVTGPIATASVDSLLPTAKPLAETTVVASSLGLRAHTSSTAPVQSITAETMQTLGISEIGEALKLMNGVTVRDYGGLGGMKTVSVRNLGAAHTGVMYDGLPVSNAQAGQIDIARFNSWNIREVALSIGTLQDIAAPASLEGYSGVLVLRSDAATQRKTDANSTTDNRAMENGSTGNGATNHGRTFLSYGSWNTLSTGFAYGRSLGSMHRHDEHSDFRLTDETRHPLSSQSLSTVLTYRHTDGDYPFVLHNGDTETHERRHNGRVDDLSGELNYRTRHFSLKGYGYLNDRQLPGGIILYNDNHHERMREANGFVQAQYDKPLGPSLSLLLRAKYNHSMTHYNDGTSRTDDPSAILHICNYRQNEYYASAGLLSSRRFDRVSLRLALLYDLQASHLHSNLSTAHSVQRTTHYAVLRGQATMQRLRLAGSMLYTANIDVRDKEFGNQDKAVGNADKDHAWTPSLSGHITLWSNGTQTLGLRYMGRCAFRLPSLNELYYYQLGNHTLDPERAREHNLGLTYTMSAGLSSPSGRSRSMNLALTVDVYHNRVKDKLISFPSSFAWKVANLGEATSCGFEASLHLDASLDLCRLGLSANYRLQDTRNLDDPSNANTYRKRLPYVPKHAASGALTLHTQWLDVGYSLQWAGERFSTTMNTFRYRLSPYCEHSLTLSRTWNQWEVQGSVLNLTDTQYELIQYYPMPGRQYRVSMKYRF